MLKVMVFKHPLFHKEHWSKKFNSFSPLRGRVKVYKSIT